MYYVIAIIGSLLIGIEFFTDSEMPVWSIILGLILTIIGYIGILIQDNKKDADNKQICLRQIKQKGFNFSDYFFENNSSTIGLMLDLNGMAINDKKDKICFMKRRNEWWSSTIIDHKDIISSEIFEDGNLITKHSRSSQLDGAIIGGLLMGDAGSIIGGLSGAQKTSMEIKTIELRVIVNSTEKPIYRIRFLGVPCNKDGALSFLYNTAIAQAQHWHALLIVLINRANKKEALLEMETESKTKEIKNIYDEISNIFNLKKEGVISEEEFEATKKKIIANFVNENN